MALILLTLIGVAIGWLGSIAMRIEEGKAVRRLVLAGFFGSLIVGLAANGGTVLGSLSWIATGVALLASIAAVVGYRYFLSRSEA
ncbi:MAG: hypothetical protein AAF697_04110 [Pseudomonadota bacterium]